jgi:eukaryotic-like serine/threonine-protein kinase
MPLTSGTRLGPYEISSPLGAGGMGEVYRATDTKLGREVAVKVLPAALATDEAARARFEREARAVAALSHPNILALHDFGQHDGIAYAVTELLEGETLRARLDHGALPLRKVLQIGADIADGLAAAHDKGFIHRDIKPENIFITADGRVKILDFGLARQAAVAGEAPGGGTTVIGTDPGTVMGTVGYMAPEQVRGEPTDQRTDIFALGCVLYEMVSGRRAFAKPTPPETMTAILREDPPALDGDSGQRPVAFQSLLHHCLEKRPAERFQSARDLAFALRSLSGSTTSGERVLAAAAVGKPAWRSRAAIAAGLVVAAAAGVLVGRLWPRTAVGGSGPQVVSFAQVSDQPGVEATPTLSPDGKSVVYMKTIGGDSDLYLLRVGGRNAVRLTPDSPEADLQPAFSPDGDRIAFRSDRDGGGIFLMAASGESVTRLTNFGYSPSWSPSGSEIVVSSLGFAAPAGIMGDATGLSVANVRTGQVRALPIPWRALQPSWSPDGTRIAYWGVRGKTGQRDIWTVAADGSDAARGGVAVTDDAALDWSPTWSPDGRYLYYSSTRGGPMNLWRVRVDERSGRVLGAPERVTAPSTWSGFLSFSRDGTRLAFASTDFHSTLFRVPFDPDRETLTGPPESVLKGTRAIRDHEISPDGQWIAFTEAGVPEDLFVARIDGTQYRRLTDDEFRDRGPAWSPDGARIAFYSDRSGTYDVWSIRPDGSGLAALTKGAGIPGFPVWSPDGASLTVGFGTWVSIASAAAPSPSDTTSMPAISASERFLPASWSRGGRIVGQVGEQSGALFTLAVFSPATKEFARVPAAVARGSYWLWPVWLTDGRRLVVRRPDGIVLVDAATGAGRMLLEVGGNMVGKSVGISRDDHWITYTETASEGDIWIATLTK